MASFESFDGLSLFYQDEGDGRTVVLLHGFAADTNVNYVRSGIFDLLLDEGYRVVTLDARGHGLSSKPTDSAAYADDAMKRDVVAISFDHDTEAVTSVKSFNLQDGQVLAFNRRETPTRGREMTVLEQLIGSIGAGSVLPNQEVTPGTHPDDRR